MHRGYIFAVLRDFFKWREQISLACILKSVWPSILNTFTGKPREMVYMLPISWPIMKVKQDGLNAYQPRWFWWSSNCTQLHTETVQLINWQRVDLYGDWEMCLSYAEFVAFDNGVHPVASVALNMLKASRFAATPRKMVYLSPSLRWITKVNKGKGRENTWWISCQDNAFAAHWKWNS